MASSTEAIRIKERLLLGASLTRLGAAISGGLIGYILTNQWNVALLAVIGVYLATLSLALSVDR